MGRLDFMTRTLTVFVASLGLTACSTNDETASATETSADTMATVTGDGPGTEGGSEPTAGGPTTESGGSTAGDSTATTDDEGIPTGTSVALAPLADAGEQHGWKDMSPSSPWVGLRGGFRAS
ncbi:hypothetical protein [Nannocystis bainbridge]|uniref:Lipoprotein n=1 Tax=Nannocystis bainbridge TaxID=2995303 RepID=A0ABT5EAF1_9BACT|nr:hypothetical protein [Nannocystis bainbridge]MDC0722831.1 hypothetical protein [Nannocystis bainbridge]